MVVCNFNYIFLAEVMKKLEEAGETDKIAEFKEGAAPALKYIYKNLKDFEFYAGESMNPDGTVSCYICKIKMLVCSAYKK